MSSDITTWGLTGTLVDAHATKNGRDGTTEAHGTKFNLRSWGLVGQVQDTITTYWYLKQNKGAYREH